jgi:hypothetical protein
MPTPFHQRTIHRVFIGFWSLLLLSGMGFKLSSKLVGWPCWEDYVVSENRTPNRLPNLRTTPVKQWGTAMDLWYNDNFAWRSRLIQFYRHVHFHWLHTSVGKEEVPGKDGWIFRKGGNWAELEDYLGVFELSPEEIGRWLELFEGRKQWAEAHGVLYLEVITPVKAQIHPEKIYPMIARHRGQGVRDQVRAALADSPARDNVLFMSDLIAGLTRQRTVFYASDHHINALGTYMIYNEIKNALAARLGPMDIPPFYTNNPPAAVRAGTQAGCFEKGRKDFERLYVNLPGQRDDGSSPALKRGGPYPSVSVVLTQPGARRTLVLAHDSFMRFPLSSWRFQEDPIRLPVPDGFDRILSLLFKRLTTRDLDHLVSVEQPAVIIEQFPEIKLTREVVGYDDTMRRAAAFARATPVASGSLPAIGTPLCVMAVLDEVTDASGAWVDMRDGKNVPDITVELHDGRTTLASLTTYPGKRRALFFPEIQAPGAPLEVRVLNGRGQVHRLEARRPAPPRLPGPTPAPP